MKKRLLAGLLVLCMVLALGLTACKTTGTTTTTPAAEDLSLIHISGLWHGCTDRG